MTDQLWKIGTATVTNGSTAVTGTGTGWQTALVTGGLFMKGGFTEGIASVESETGLTLAQPWAGASGTGVYSILRETSSAASVVDLYDRLSKALITLSLVGIHPNAAGTLAKRDALVLGVDDEDFIFLHAELLVEFAFYRWTGTSWDGPFPVAIPGDPGDPGSPGEPGLDGNDGAAATIAVGTVTPLAPGETPTVVNAGTSAAAVFNFGLVSGAAGADGTDPGVLLTFDTGTADADPGSGLVRANNADLSAATVLYVSKANRAGSNIAAYLLAMDDSTNTVKGALSLTDAASNLQAIWQVTAVADAIGYVKVTLANHTGETAFADALAVSLEFSRAGDKGTDGAGTGDVVGPASSVDNRVALFDGVTGKLLKDSGVVLGTAASKTTGTGSGNVPELDGSGKLDTSVIPAVAITDVFVVASQAAMLALTAEQGDIAIRSDLNKSFALQTNSPTTLADWKELLTPTDAVLAVAGLTGTISAAALKAALAIAVADITDASANGRSLISAANYAAMRTLLGLVIGTNVQAFDAQLSSLIRQNSQSAAYTLVLPDGGKHIYHPAADTTARIWTIPANASVAFPIGTAVTFDNDFGAGAITIAITTDTLVLVGAAGSTGSRTLASGGQATAIKVSATRWRISGTGLT